MVHNIGRMKRYCATENVPEQLLDDYIDEVEDEERGKITGFIVKSFNSEEEFYNISVVEKMMKSCDCPYFVQHRSTPCKHMFLAYHLHKDISVFSNSTSTSYTIFPSPPSPTTASASSVVALVRSTEDDDIDIDIEENEVEESQAILRIADFPEDICDFEDEQHESITLEEEAENNLKDVNILWNEHQERNIYVSTKIVEKIEDLKRLLQKSKEENDMDKDNEDTFMMERTSLVVNKGHAMNELEETMKESTSDLPLGKALHLLVNIHGHIFDKAVDTIKKFTPEELTIKTVEMPTVRAILSIENYLSNSDHVKTSFKQVYDSLHEKFIKRSKSNANSESAMRVIGYFILYSKHKDEVQQCICDELSLDKRSQLAAVLLLAFLFTQYISPTDHFSNLVSLFISPLVHISEKYSKSPTLLACSACDLALQLTQYITLHLHDTTVQPTAPTTKIMELDNDDSLDDQSATQQFSSALEKIEPLFYIMEKWQKPTDPLETIAYSLLHSFLKYSLEKTQHVAESWNLILTYLTPKSILLKKPFTTKKQKSILLHESSERPTPIAKIILLLVLQKGQLLELYGSNRKSVIYSSEEEEIKSLFTTEYKHMVRLFTQYKTILKDLIIQLVIDLPYLCKTTDINSEELVQALIEKIDYDKDSTGWMVSLCNKYPESSVCNLLFHIIHKDKKSESSFDLLGDIIMDSSTETMDVILKNLLPLLKSHNQACELLIQCMSYTHLPTLIQRLMPMTVVDNQQERMTYIALISKALLHESWASNSILLYIEMIMNVETLKGFVAPTAPKLDELQQLNPASIINYENTSRKTIKEYGEYELEDICAHLIIPFQLWGSKAEKPVLESGLRQLVEKTYGLPTEETCINAWKYLSHEFIKDHSLIWCVIEQCLHVMTTQPKIPKGPHGHKVLLLRLSPMLILQTIPKEAFDVVKLPKSCIDLLHLKIQKLNIPPNTIKQTQVGFQHSPLCIQLLDELLSRSLEVYLGQEMKDYTAFSTHLITKIFCI